MTPQEAKAAEKAIEDAIDLLTAIGYTIKKDLIVDCITDATFVSTSTNQGTSEITL